MCTDFCIGEIVWYRHRSIFVFIRQMAVLLQRMPVTTTAGQYHAMAQSR